MVKQFFYSFVFICTLLQAAHAANISAFVNRQNIQVNESFNLVFEADGSVDADPDFSPLSVYFDILNQSQSSNMTIVNGNFSRKTVWTLVLLAKQAGTYAIPAIEFGNDQSKPLTITIQKSSNKSSTTDQSIFLEAEVDQTSTYVQSQLIYTVRLFRSVDIQNASLTEPELSDADAIVEKIGDDKRYQTNRNGVRYIVVERQYAIFPQQSGQLTINPVEFNGQIVSQRRSFFDISPFNNVSRRVLSKKINIDIKSMPAVFANKHWLPSTEVKLQDSWPENTEFKVGEPVTRTISLLAAGLTASQLPEIAAGNVNNIKQYPDQPTMNNLKDENGIVGIREEKVAYIPTRAGSITLPEINIPWWNTRTGKLQYARIEAKKINVIASAVLPQTLVPVETLEKTVQQTQSSVQSNESSSVWIYSTLLFATLWILTLSMLLKQKKYKTTTTELSQQKSVKKQPQNLSKKLAGACHQNNAELCKNILIDWGQQQWPSKSILSLGDIYNQLEEGALKYQINSLNQALYANSTEQWQADDLLKAFEMNKGIPLEKNQNSVEILQPLNKLQ